MERKIINEYISEETKQVSKHMMQMINEGKIRNHKLGNTSTLHHGEAEEQELGNYMRFLTTRNFYNISCLYGKDNDGEY